MRKAPATFKQVMDGEWIKPQRRNHKMACCDCGLVHRVNYRIVRMLSKSGRGKPTIEVVVQAFRDERSTAGRRRGHKVRDKIRALANKVRR